MNSAVERARERIVAQKTRLPAMFAKVDFDRDPERFTRDPAPSISPTRDAFGVKVTDDDLDLVRAYTMLGDEVGDAYAMLMPKFGFRGLVDMLVAACDRGVETIEGAPDQLVAFIRAMEATPSWVNMDLVREGARRDLIGTAVIAPFAIRGAFIATFLNKYSALPMALTGTLTNDTAAKRVNETATFFAVTTLPDALDRFGEGFKAAAMVRLMHSMVRVNALRSNSWDSAVYGVPIPQVDQMPAGLIPIFLLSYRMLREGRREFTPAERAQVELARYRCFLLGLPEDILSDSAEGIVRFMNARNSTLRNGFDDATCGALVRATLAAYLPADRSLTSRIQAAFERRFAKTFFLKHFLGGDERISRAMGVNISAGDKATAVLVAIWLGLQTGFYSLTRKIPGLSGWTDRALVKRIRKLLKRYGHAAFESDSGQYRPASSPAA